METLHKPRVCYIINAVGRRPLEFEWALEYLSEGTQLSLIVIDELGISDEHGEHPLVSLARQRQIEAYTLHTCGEMKMIPALVPVLVRLLRRLRPHLVHTHLPLASVAGLTAAALLGIKRLYTRHTPLDHWAYYRHGVWYDYWCNRLAHHIIAVSKVVKWALTRIEHVPEEKVTVVPHGLKWQEVDSVDASEVDRFKATLGIEGRYPIVGVVSRFVHWKGVEFAIEAFRELLRDYPGAVLVLASGIRSPYSAVIEKELKNLPEDSWRVPDFVPRIFALYRCIDILVHVPRYWWGEGFGQVYIEAMAAGVPVVCTLSGIALEIIENEKNALVVPYRDSRAIYHAIKRLLEDEHLRRTLVRNARESVKPFTAERKFAQIADVYRRLLYG